MNGDRMRTSSPRWRGKSAGANGRLALALALAFHLVLLALPLRQPTPMPAPRPLVVEVRSEPFVPDQPRAAVQAERPRVQPIRTVETPTAHSPPMTVSPEPARQPARPPLSTAYLLESASFFNLPDRQAPAAERVLGVPVIPALPESLTRPILPLAPNAFADYVLPREQEVLDQWMDMTGIAHAVIRTPSGDVLCGRLQPWDPMNPLVEHVALYRPCGGGGKRKPGTRSPFLRAN